MGNYTTDGIKQALDQLEIEWLDIAAKKMFLSAALNFADRGLSDVEMMRKLGSIADQAEKSARNALSTAETLGMEIAVDRAESRLLSLGTGLRWVLEELGLVTISATPISDDRLAIETVVNGRIHTTYLDRAGVEQLMTECQDWLDNGHQIELDLDAARKAVSEEQP